MKSSASLLAEDPTPKAPAFLTPNADGVFENAEQIYVPLHHGNICHLLIAQAGPHEFYSGHKFFTRQPRNMQEQLASEASGSVRTRERALTNELELALYFFSEHKGPLGQIVAWAKDHLSAEAFDVLEFSAPAQKIGKPIGELINEAVAADNISKGASVAQDVPASSSARLTADEAAEASVVPGAESNGPAGVPLETVPPAPHHAEIAVDAIEPNPDQPRKGRNQAKQAELVESLRNAPLLHPIVVRDMGAGREGKPDTCRYQIIVGEGRWLAYKELGRATIEAKVFSGVDGATAIAWALVENLQRSDMNALEEAEGFSWLSRMGWTTARMAQQTGKPTRTIRAALGLMKLPESVRELIRLGELSARQARALARWVVAPGFEACEKEEEFLARPRGFVTRPRVCEIIADIAAKSNCNISSDELAVGVPAEAIGALTAEKLIVQIPDAYWGAVCASAMANADFYEVSLKRYTFAVAAWKETKKKIDAEVRAAAAEKAARAAKRVEVAMETQVSMPITALKESKAEHVVLKGELERYADHLPGDCVANGIDPETKAEVPVCTQPEKLVALREAERHALAEDLNEKLCDADVRARAKLKKLKRVGAREMAFIIEGTQVDFNASIEEAEAWAEAGLKRPKNWQRMSLRQQLETLDPVEQFRLFINAQLCEQNMDSDCADLLRWILETPKLGLITEDPREGERLLKRLAAELFAAKPAAAVLAPVAQKPAPIAKKKPVKKAGKGGRK